MGRAGLFMWLSPLCVFSIVTLILLIAYFHSWLVSTLILIPTNSILGIIILMEIKESHEFLLGGGVRLKDINARNRLRNLYK